ncbi:hypothetical protein HGRIS_001230 [Hohenbuehelia grisea]|uniref:Uncharacterized protein n=1 Tax=Hohenbuehelia grisea TaxID=104357 RepID=A0ABR3JPY6_9AGAR
MSSNRRTAHNATTSGVKQPYVGADINPRPTPISIGSLRGVVKVESAALRSMPSNSVSIKICEVCCQAMLIMIPEEEEAALIARRETAVAAALFDDDDDLPLSSEPEDDSEDEQMFTSRSVPARPSQAKELAHRPTRVPCDDGVEQRGRRIFRTALRFSLTHHDPTQVAQTSRDQRTP